MCDYHEHVSDVTWDVNGSYVHVKCDFTFIYLDYYFRLILNVAALPPFIFSILGLHISKLKTLTFNNLLFKTVFYSHKEKDLLI